MKVTIIGAGIGGLTLALQLHRAGIACEVFEASEAIRPMGVGINLLPHSVAELTSLGLGDALAATGIETSALAYYNQHGQQIWHEPRGRAAGYPVPQYSIHRGAFQMLLHAAALERLGADNIHTGQVLESVQRYGSGLLDASHEPAVFTLKSRADGSVTEHTAEVLVGADGIHSAVRRVFYPTGDQPRFSRRMLWRGVTEAAPYLDGRSMFMAGHQDQKFVAYPISEPARQQGRSYINWIAELRVPGTDDDTPPKSDWNKRVDKSVFADQFKGWRWDWIDIPALVDGAEAIYEFPMVDKDPLPGWTRGRVTLLGDAAHPMYPIGSNGSAQAVMDTRALTDALLQFKDPAMALREYEAERLPRTAGIVLRNRMNGPEQVMQLAHERAPQGFTDINAVVPHAELAAIALRYKQLAGFDPKSVVVKA
jgi:2-polyprenyl-6-methoxyphenol hydroxylase-like FAD-dependent oxidoreductase